MLRDLTKEVIRDIPLLRAVQPAVINAHLFRYPANTAALLSQPFNHIFVIVSGVQRYTSFFSPEV